MSDAVLLQKSKTIHIVIPSDVCDDLRAVLFREGNLTMSAVFSALAEQIACEDPHVMSLLKELRYKRAVSTETRPKKLTAKQELEDLFLIIEQTSPFAKSERGEER